MLLAIMTPIGIQAQSCANYNAALPTGYTLGTELADLGQDLAAALDCANDRAGLDRIIVPDNQVVTLTDNPPFIEDEVIISSPGHSIIRADGISNSIFAILTGVPVTLANLTLTGADAGAGGAINNVGDLTLINMRVIGNRSGSTGGGIRHSSFASGLTLVNTLVLGNESVSSGGGLYLEQDATLINSTIAGNQSGPSTIGGAGIYVQGSGTVVTIRNSIFSDNFIGDQERNAFVNSGLITVAYSLYGTIVGNSSEGAGNVTGQPAGFVNPVIGAPTVAGDYRVFAGSLALDVGDNTLLPTEQALNFDVDGDGSIENEAVSVDIAGNPRVQAATVDMGAYEGAVTAQTLLTAFDALPDHVLQGISSITATLEVGLPDKGLPPLAALMDTLMDATAQNATGTLSVVYSADATCDANDTTVGQRAFDFEGESAEVIVGVTVPLAALTQAANSADPPSQALPYTSQDVGYLCGLVIDNPADFQGTVDAIAEQGTRSDDITYFPWDADADGTVTTADFDAFRAAVNTSAPLYDYDGNGPVTPLEAVGVLLRLGYTRNSVSE